jgi:hypothetical protein
MIADGGEGTAEAGMAARGGWGLCDRGDVDQRGGGGGIGGVGDADTECRVGGAGKGRASRAPWALRGRGGTLAMQPTQTERVLKAENSSR